jgi:hypothetical protein
LRPFRPQTSRPEPLRPRVNKRGFCAMKAGSPSLTLKDAIAVLKTSKHGGSAHTFSDEMAIKCLYCHAVKEVISALEALEASSKNEHDFTWTAHRGKDGIYRPASSAPTDRIREKAKEAFNLLCEVQRDKIDFDTGFKIGQAQGILQRGIIDARLEGQRPRSRKSTSGYGVS